MKKDWKVLVGNNIDLLKSYEDNTFDSIVTDPPYGIEFLGKDWDKDTGAMETWQECLRVLKPGGYILAFSAARTYHNLATNIESAGFEIRDQIMWLYSSGFPKAQDMGKAIQKRQGVEETNSIKGGARPSNKMATPYAEGSGYKQTIATSPEAQQWAGYKTALKPAHEPIVMARKPFKGSCIDNVLKHGTGALNIDGSRITVADDELKSFQKEWDRDSRGKMDYLKLDGRETDYVGGSVKDYVPEGRYPSNVIGEVTDYQKFFYCPKVGRAERHVGFEQNNITKNPDGMFDASYRDETRGKTYMHVKGNLDHIPFVENSNGNVGNGKAQMERPKVGNNHPTVKPVELMKYLVKLVTPPNGIVLDPFNGSGSTGMACVELGYEYVGCELDPNYVEIATNRIAAWEAKFNDDHFDSLFDK